MKKKVIIIGATSGIGRALALCFLRDGHEVGLAGRREPLLEDLKSKFPGKSFTQCMDVSRAEEAVTKLNDLIAEMNGLDIMVLSSGIGRMDRDLDWDIEKETIEVNVTGFTALANAAMRYFMRRRSGHLVAISSISAVRGWEAAPAYSASKAFVSNYMQGLRRKMAQLALPITLTDIQPGYVATEMSEGLAKEDLFWVAPVEKAAGQIYDAIKARRPHAYITKRWRIIAWLMKIWS